jgi:hypothetical protein
MQFFAVFHHTMIQPRENVVHRRQSGKSMRLKIDMLSCSEASRVVFYDKYFTYALVLFFVKTFDFAKGGHNNLFLPANQQNP